MRWPPSPGEFTVVMAVVAGLYALSKRPKRWVKAAFIAALILCAAGEIYATNYAQQVSDQHFALIVSKLDEETRLILAAQQAQTRLAELSQLSQVLSHASKPSDLKRRALLLSNSILEFLAERQARDPFSFQNLKTTWDKLKFGWDTAVFAKYDQQTVMIYTERFSTQVNTVHDELAEQGLRDGQLDLYYKNPISTVAVRIIAERIGALAEQIR